MRTLFLCKARWIATLLHSGGQAVGRAALLGAEPPCQRKSFKQEGVLRTGCECSFANIIPPFRGDSTAKRTSNNHRY
jgi:hypothetical protein